VVVGIAAADAATGADAVQLLAAEAHLVLAEEEVACRSALCHSQSGRRRRVIPVQLAQLAEPRSAVAISQ